MNNLVIMKDQQAVTSSLQVAETFNKSHKHVLEAIDNLKEGVAENWADLFYEDTYIHPQNRQPYRVIYMNRDGFTLLAMGFTGKKALKFKLKYIEAFNKMENELKLGYPTTNIGGYQVPSNYRGALLLAADLQEQVEIMKPKVTYYDKVLSNPSLVTITVIAKDYGMSGREMNAKLHELGIQYKQGKTWLLYSKYQHNGWTHSDTTMVKRKDGTEKAVLNTKWTQKGRLGLYEVLKQHNIYPMIEQLMEV